LLAPIFFNRPAFANADNVCNSLDVSQDVAVPASVGVLSTLRLNSHPTFSEATLSFTNMSSSRIDVIFALVEFYTGTRRLMTIPLNAIAKLDYSHDFPISLSALQEYRIQQQVESGTAVSLHGYSPKTITTCPSKAVVSYFAISYGDGHSFSQSLANWHSDAVPYTVPNASGHLLRGERFILTTEITVDPEGHVRVRDAGHLNLQQISDLQKVLESWLFLPAMDGGRRISADIPIVLENESCTQNLPTPQRITTWLTTVICPRGDASVEQEVYVGGFLQ
jgi:hypothetical protein